MPYKYTGDYYSRAAGDYLYSRGGLPIVAGLGFLAKKLAPRAIRFAGRLLGRRGATAVATAGAAAVPFIAGRQSGLRPPPGMQKVKGVRGAIQRFLPGGATGYEKRRTMNVLNPRALSRATRRLAGFRNKAEKALRELGFTVKRTGVARRARCAK